jgi:hypothetical protein
MEAMMTFPHNGGEDFEFDKDVDVNVDVDYDLDVDVKVDVDKDIDIDANVDVKVDVDGNYADWNIDVEAIGENSAAELDLVVVVTDDMSMITTSGYAAVD